MIFFHFFPSDLLFILPLRFIIFKHIFSAVNIAFILTVPKIPVTVVPKCKDFCFYTLPGTVKGLDSFLLFLNSNDKAVA